MSDEGGSPGGGGGTSPEVVPPLDPMSSLSTILASESELTEVAKLKSKVEFLVDSSNLNYL